MTDAKDQTQQSLHLELLGLLPDGFRLSLEWNTLWVDAWGDPRQAYREEFVESDIAHAAIRGAAYGWLHEGDSCVSLYCNRYSKRPWEACIDGTYADTRQDFETEVEALIYAVKLAKGEPK